MIWLLSELLAMGVLLLQSPSKTDLGTRVHIIYVYTYTFISLSTYLPTYSPYMSPISCCYPQCCTRGYLPHNAQVPIPSCRPLPPNYKQAPSSNILCWTIATPCTAIFFILLGLPPHSIQSPSICCCLSSPTPTDALFTCSGSNSHSDSCFTVLRLWQAILGCSHLLSMHVLLAYLCSNTLWQPTKVPSSSCLGSDTWLPPPPPPLPCRYRPCLALPNGFCIELFRKEESKNSTVYVTYLWSTFWEMRC